MKSDTPTSTPTPPTPGRVPLPEELESDLPEELQALTEHWLVLLILGSSVMVLGVLAITFSFIATLATVAIFGTLVLLAGALHLVNAVTAKGWRGFFIHLLVGVLYVVVGLLMMNHPLGAAAGITLMLAAAFMAGGIIRIVVSAIEHFHGWGWVMLNGFISLLLGIYIWRHFPESAFWVIGLFVGIDLIFSGWAWVFLALAVRQVPKPTA
jgi:uncharacterized membrane protein HdeD (DUF308 family)